MDLKQKIILSVLLLVAGIVCILIGGGLFAAASFWATTGVATGQENPYASSILASGFVFLIIGIALIATSIAIFLLVDAE